MIVFYFAVRTPMRCSAFTIQEQRERRAHFPSSFRKRGHWETSNCSFPSILALDFAHPLWQQACITPVACWQNGISLHGKSCYKTPQAKAGQVSFGYDKKYWLFQLILSVFICWVIWIGFPCAFWASSGVCTVLHGWHWLFTEIFHELLSVEVQLRCLRQVKNYDNSLE